MTAIPKAELPEALGEISSHLFIGGKLSHDYREP
jgi:hypothetical protein